MKMLTGLGETENLKRQGSYQHLNKLGPPIYAKLEKKLFLLPNKQYQLK